jgi:hypothetical protein
MVTGMNQAVKTTEFYQWTMNYEDSCYIEICFSIFINIFVQNNDIINCYLSCKHYFVVVFWWLMWWFLVFQEMAASTEISGQLEELRNENRSLRMRLSQLESTASGPLQRLSDTEKLLLNQLGHHHSSAPPSIAGTEPHSPHVSIFVF